MAHREFDLLGDPIPESRGKPGRTGHVATAENANKIRVLLVAGWVLKEIAEEIGISAPTLRKHYFSNAGIDLTKARVHAIAQIKGRTMLQLDREATAGNVSAMKELRKITEVQSARFGAVEGPPKTPKAKPKGKKQSQRDAASQPTGGWSDVLNQDKRPN